MPRIRLFHLFLLLFLLIIAPPTSFAAQSAATDAQSTPGAPGVPERNPRWAKPVPMPGLPNLHRVDATLYRSAQPEKDSLRSLQLLGIKTVISLRKTNKDAALLKGGGIELIQRGANTWSLDDAWVIANLRAIRAASANGPVLVHCRHGADRTGLTIAMYRMTMQGWSREDARSEMVDGGFGFHTLWANITAYLDTVDVAAIKAKVMQ